MEKNGNGSGEPIISIRASLKKIVPDVDKDLELVIFIAKRKNIAISIPGNGHQIRV